MSPDISVIVVSWNGRRYLEACLDAVAGQRDVDAETILVDNGSTDGTVDFVRARFPRVRVVALSENQGFAGGNNAGARVASGAHVAFLNNDTVAAPTWLRALRDGMDLESGFALTTSRIVYMHDPDTIDSAGDGFLLSGGAFKRRHGAPAASVSESCEVFGVSGAACLMPTAVFNELGGFDESFVASHEDVDLSYRARLRGYRCRYVADAIVRHHGSATLGTLSPFAVFQGQRNLEWVYVKNTPGRLLARSLPAHLLYDAAAALYFARRGLFRTFLSAKIAAVRGLRRVVRERRQVQQSRRVSSASIEAQLERRWLSLKTAEKRFDGSLADRSRRERLAGPVA